MLLALYKALGSAAYPFIKDRLGRAHEAGSDERRGSYDDAKLATLRAAGDQNIWIHAVSVGEVQAASPIVHAARADGYDGALTLSTVTPTGARNAQLLIGDEMTTHIFAPWDFAKIVRRSCEALRPSLYAAVETEVWPALLGELRARGVPRVLANARVSDRTWARRRKLAPLYRIGFNMFDRLLARSDEDARRLAAMGAQERRIAVTGDAKIDAIAARKSSADGERAALARALRIGDAPLFVAGSTHEGEDEVVLAAFQDTASAARDARLVIVPRHPERAADIVERARADMSAELYSTLQIRGGSHAPKVAVVDVIGVLFPLYSFACGAFIGGSIAPRGGQNILEAAAWGTPAAHGPHMEDFALPTSELDASGEAFAVRGAAELASVWRECLPGGGIARSRCEGGYFKRNAGASKRIWREMSALMRDVG